MAEHRTCQDCGMRHAPGDKGACIEGHGDDPPSYTEDCCFNDPRDHCKGRRCPCGCHTVADHPLQAFCEPATSCPMRHPCHVPGCTIPPEWHPESDDIQVTIHGTYGQGPMPVEFRDAMAEMVRLVKQGIDDGTLPRRRRTPQEAPE